MTGIESFSKMKYSLVLLARRAIGPEWMRPLWWALDERLILINIDE
jgi:hypothetical protein